MAIDGFLVLYDMSINDAKLAERQAQLVGGLLATLAGAKRSVPFALVTTKNDALYQLPRYVTTSTPSASAASASNASTAASAAVAAPSLTLVPTAAYQKLEAIFSSKELKQHASSILRCAALRSASDSYPYNTNTRKCYLFLAHLISFFGLPERTPVLRDLHTDQKISIAIE